MASTLSSSDTPSFWRRRSIRTVLVVALLAMSVGGYAVLRPVAGKTDAESKKDKPAVTLEFAATDLAQVQVQPLALSVPVSGSLSPVTQALVKSTVSGEVRRILVREGESVRKGAVVAEIDTVDARSRLDAALADQAERKSRLVIAQRNRDTNQALLAQNFISQNAFDQLLSTYQGSEAAVQWADAQVKLARKALEDAVVKAPMSGQVAKRLVNAGERVAPDAPLLSLVDLSVLELEATVPVSDVARMAPGQVVRFRVDGFEGREFEGRVERINPMAEVNSRSIKLYVSVRNADGTLRAGMFAQGKLALSQSRSVPVIPVSAVFEEAGQTYVFTVEDGKIARHAVTLGLRDEATGMVEAASGLGVGLQVVRVRMNGLKADAPATIVATKSS